MPAVCANDDVRSDLELSVGCRCDEAAYAAVRLMEPGDLGLHQQAERRVRARLKCHEIEKIPLRHQRDELAPRWQMREIAQRQRLAPDAARDVANLPVRPLEEFFEDVQLMQDFEG